MDSGRCAVARRQVATYIKEYHELTQKDGLPFVLGAVWKDLFFAAFILLSIAGCAAYFGPFSPSGPPNPTIIQTAPRPDFFFLWLYAVLSFLPPSMETPALLVGPAVVILALLLLPFVFGEGEKTWQRRPIRCPHDSVAGGGTGHAYTPCRKCTVEPRHGCMERDSDSVAISAQRFCTSAARRPGFPGEAMSQLPLA